MHDSRAIANNANLGTQVAKAGLLISFRAIAKPAFSIGQFVMKDMEAIASDGCDILGCLLVLRIAHKGAQIALLGNCLVKDSRGLRGGLPSCMMPPVELLLSAPSKKVIIA